MAFIPEAFALAWHLRHPYPVTVADKHLSVPLLSPASYDAPTDLGIFVSPGWFRARVLGQRHWALMTFSRTIQRYSKEEQQTIDKNMQAPGRVQFTKIEEIRVGTDMLYCRHQAATAKLPVYSITCTPETGNLGASFMGDEDAVATFYQILRTAK